MGFAFVAKNGERLTRPFWWDLPDPPELTVEPPLTEKELEKGRYTLTGRVIVGMPDLAHDQELSEFFRKHGRLEVR